MLRHFFEGYKEAGILSGYKVRFGVKLDMVSVVEDGGLIERECETGGNWIGNIYS